MSNTSTSAEKRIKEECLKAMAGFMGFRRKQWYCWGAIHRPCPTCGVGKGRPCENLAERKKQIRAITQWPHEDRVDWTRMQRGLMQRGYIGDN